MDFDVHGEKQVLMMLLEKCDIIHHHITYCHSPGPAFRKGEKENVWRERRVSVCSAVRGQTHRFYYAEMKVSSFKETSQRLRPPSPTPRIMLFVIFTASYEGGV